MVLTRDELGHYISEQMETFEDDDDIDSEIQIFQNALEFPSKKPGGNGTSYRDFSSRLSRIS